MSQTPAHLRSSATWAAWTVLVSMGGTEMIYNIWHAVHGGHMRLGLALLYGLAPVLAAILLSHIVAEYDGGWFLQGAAFVIMGAAMTLSAHATAATVLPAAGGRPYAWMFGLALDAASLVALRVILTGRSRRAAAALAVEAAQARAGQIQADLDAARAQVQAAAVQAAGDRDQFRAELASVRSELEAEVQRLRSALNKTPNPQSGSGVTRPRSSGPAKSSGSPPAPKVPKDVDVQAEALVILAANPGITGSELGRQLGTSESYGCRLKNRLAHSVAGPDTGGHE